MYTLTRCCFVATRSITCCLSSTTGRGRAGPKEELDLVPLVNADAVVNGVGVWTSVQWLLVLFTRPQNGCSFFEEPEVVLWFSCAGGGVRSESEDPGVGYIREADA